jgi:hypothetical protein
MPTVDLNRRIDLLASRLCAVGQFGLIGLELEGTRRARRGQTDPIVIEPAILAVDPIPGGIALALRLGHALVMGRHITAAECSNAELDALIEVERGLL